MSKTHCSRCGITVEPLTDFTEREKTFSLCHVCRLLTSSTKELCHICHVYRTCPDSIGVSGSEERLPLCADCAMGMDKGFEDMAKQAGKEEQEKERAIWDFHATQYLHSIEGSHHKMRTPTGDAADAATYADEMMRYRKRCT